MANSENTISGDRLSDMTDKELREAVNTVSIYARVYPSIK
jgi:magnesium-transporting ATPase (P-type)